MGLWQIIGMQLTLNQSEAGSNPVSPSKEKQMKQLKNTQILWHLGYYDAPLSGVLLHEGELRYFDLLEEYEPPEMSEEEENMPMEEYWGWYRKFAVYELSDDDKIRLVTTHAIWQAHMGLHTDYFPFNARKLRRERIKKKKDNEVPILHYGPTGRSDKAWEDCKELREKFESDFGKFEKGERAPIGFIYYDQLFGKDDGH